MKQTQTFFIENLCLRECFLGIHGYIRGNLPFLTNWNDQFSIQLHFMKTVDTKLGYKVFLHMHHIIMKQGQTFLIENLWLRKCFGYPPIHPRQLSDFGTLNYQFFNFKGNWSLVQTEIGHFHGSKNLTILQKSIKWPRIEADTKSVFKRHYLGSICLILTENYI